MQEEHQTTHYWLLTTLNEGEEHRNNFQVSIGHTQHHAFLNNKLNHSLYPQPKILHIGVCMHAEQTLSWIVLFLVNLYQFSTMSGY